MHHLQLYAEVDAATGPTDRSPRTEVEEAKLRRRPPEWRLAAKAWWYRSLIVLTPPQADLPEEPDEETSQW